MAEFQILRYLKRWRYLIIIFALIGSMLVYMYGQSKQSYTATVVFEYTNSQAADGLNPDNTPIDTSEILSATVITNLIEKLDLTSSVESLRSSFDITSIVPDEELIRKEAALERNEDYEEYNPTVYKISFTVGSSSSASYARNVLDALMSCYFSYYCQKHVDYSTFPNNAANVSTDDFDFLECEEMLRENADSIDYYLSEQAKSYPNFYSATTGYSFSMLHNRYVYLRDNRLEELYAYILNGKLTSQLDQLIERKRNDIANSKIQIANYEYQIAELKKIISQFGQKTLDGQMVNDYSNVDTTDATETNKTANAYIVTNVEDPLGTNRAPASADSQTTTYDRLILQYADLCVAKVDAQNSMGQAQEVLNTYTSASVNSDKNSSEAQWASQRIVDIAQEFDELYEIALRTIDEFNEVNGADNIAMRSSIVTNTAVNVELYLLLAIVLFFIIGCVFAIFLGRLDDFVNYYLLSDKTTGLPSRQRCDVFIDGYSKERLPDSFSCVVLRIALQYPQNSGFTRTEGDRMLEWIGRTLRTSFKKVTFKGYNGNGMFIIMDTPCSHERSVDYVTQIKEAIDEYNIKATYPMDYSVASSTSTSDGVFEIRELLRRTVVQLNNSENTYKVEKRTCCDAAKGGI